MLYEYLANLVIAFSVATPFYLLLEAPLTNLERMLNSGSSSKNEDSPPEKNVSSYSDVQEHCRKQCNLGRIPID
ncbi:hypothetical protein CEXT_239531 [Caerostris extrusa]|uniref:Uncharacterized protein n=1 Tax=Caerostris extrusa TaxID=172846 RepID=A0AAV4XBE4_CAEEX|nr:hypothetical protein CEXT_239531 [Caerostris extrusa]